MLALFPHSSPCNTPHAFTRKKQTRRLRRVKALNTKPADPVGLRIGRPDIGAYLAGTFATKKGAPQASRGVDESGMDTTIGRVMDVSAPRRDIVKTLLRLPRERPPTALRATDYQSFGGW